MAAVLAGGPVTFLSGRSAAALWDLPCPQRRGIHVTTPLRLRARPQIIFHCCQLASDEVETRNSIPVTTVARTVFDLAADVGPHHVERVMNEAEDRLLADVTPLAVLLDRYPRRRGTRVIKSILGEAGVGARRTHSELEVAFAAFIDERGLPRPELNVWLNVGGHWVEADCLWRKQRVIVELDGRSTHDRSAAFESDRLRDRRTIAAGLIPIRITHRQLTHDGDAIACDLLATFARDRS